MEKRCALVLTVPLLGSVVFVAMSLAALGFRREGTLAGIAVAIAGSASGLALIGARSRPWMTLVAGPLAGGCVWLVPFNDGWFWLACAAMYLTYGALMLYGTSRVPPDGFETTKSS